MNIQHSFFVAFLVSCLFLSGWVATCGDDDDDDNDSEESQPTDDDATDDDVADDDADDDAADETWTDPSSGLTWQVTPSITIITWEEAKAYCDNLTLDGGGWHLPTISELRTLIRGCDATVTGGNCGVTDDCLNLGCCNDPCGGCEYMAGPGSGGAYWPDEISEANEWHWSSSQVADGGNDAWCVYFYLGSVYNGFVANQNSARCVRP